MTKTKQCGLGICKLSCSLIIFHQETTQTLHWFTGTYLACFVGFPYCIYIQFHTTDFIFLHCGPGDARLCEFHSLNFLPALWTLPVSLRAELRFNFPNCHGAKRYYPIWWKSTWNLISWMALLYFIGFQPISATAQLQRLGFTIFRLWIRIDRAYFSRCL